MAEIKKIYRQTMNPSRFIGKRYTTKVCVDFGETWLEWIEKEWFDQLAALARGRMKEVYEDGDAFIALMREKDGCLEYWIGYFMPPDIVAPEGYQSMDFPKCELGTAWVYGMGDDVLMKEDLSWKSMISEGYKLNDEWCIERYVCPRFTTPDEKGNVILDMCFFIE